MNFRSSFFRGFHSILKTDLWSALRLVESIWEDPKKTKDFQEQQLTSILKHTQATCDFYRDFPVDNLQSWPVVTKKDLLRGIAHSSLYKNKPLYKVTTSGSTGTPFTCFHNPRKRTQVFAENIFMSRLSGYQVGDPLIYIRNWTKATQKPWWKNKIINSIPIDIARLDPSTFKKVIQIAEKQPCAIIGYASFFDAFTKYLQVEDLKIPPFHSALAISESLSPETARKFFDYTQTPLNARYSNMENGIIAQQVAGSNYEYLINQASYIIEILQLDNDAPAQPGEKGRIVITDLFNEAMPFIRYDTGDLGIVGQGEHGTSTVLSSVEGRRVDQIFDTQGQMVSPFFITNLMWEFPKVKQFQFIQKDEAAYSMVLNAQKEDLDTTYLIQRLKECFGLDATIEIQWVIEIPILESGKRKHVVNRWKN